MGFNLFLGHNNGFPRWLSGKESACQSRSTWVRFQGQEDPLEKEMATHSSMLAWKIPRTEEPGGLQSRQGHKESDTLSTHAHRTQKEHFNTAVTNYFQTEFRTLENG